MDKIYVELTTHMSPNPKDHSKDRVEYYSAGTDYPFRGCCPYAESKKEALESAIKIAYAQAFVLAMKKEVGKIDPGFIKELRRQKLKLTDALDSSDKILDFFGRDASCSVVSKKLNGIIKNGKINDLFNIKEQKMYVTE